MLNMGTDIEAKNGNFVTTNVKYLLVILFI